MYKLENPLRDTRNMPADFEYPCVANYGGGVNSTAMIIDILRRGLRLDKVIFADTGEEWDHTYNYVKIFDKWLNKRGLSVTTVRETRYSSISDKAKKNNFLPSVHQRWCTIDFKITPIKRELRKFQSHVFQYIGIDYGEVRRMKEADVDYTTLLYPLVDMKLDRIACQKIIESEGLPVPQKSGCHFCFFHSKANIYKVWRDHRDMFNATKQMEKNILASGKSYQSQKYGLRKDGTYEQLEREFMAHPLKFEQALAGNMKLDDFNLDAECEGSCMT